MNGILLVDKPPDYTSHDVVAKLRGILRERRLGHAGTLDPMATGLLVIFAGRATRAAQFAEAHDKEYVFSMRLGLRTDTQDIWGNALSQNDAPGITEDCLREVSAAFQGRISQIPPMYSAIKRGGRKLYELARKGEIVEREPRTIEIKSLTYLGLDELGDPLYTVRCSKGTYVRTLCDDMGIRLGCGAAMSSLRRTAAGRFQVKDAHSIGHLAKAASESGVDSLLLPTDTLFEEYPAITADAGGERKLRTGAPFTVRETEISGPCRVYGESGEFLALCEANHGVIRTVKSFFEV